MHGVQPRMLEIVAVGAMGALLVRTIWLSGGGERTLQPLEGSTVLLGRELFTHYLLPFEIVSLLLLVAMVGVILLSKKDLK